MIAGRLNKRITIEHTAERRADFFGEEEKAQKVFIPARADVQWGSGRKQTANLEVVYSYSVTFIVWKYLYKRITEGDIVCYAGKRYQVISLEPVPEQNMLYIRAETA